MTTMFRFSPSRAALAYIALSVLALALFAIPLWYAWTVNISTFRAYVDGPDTLAIAEKFHDEGVEGAVAAIEAQVPFLSGDEILVLADASNVRLAGNLPAWPPEVPAAAGTYGLVIDRAGAPMRVVVTHSVLPGGYQLLMGRESARFQSLVDLFWYGIGGVTAIVLIVGAAFGWGIRRALLAEVQDITRSASSIAQDEQSRRLETRGRPGALGALAATVNGMLDELANRNVRLEAQIAIRREAELELSRAHDIERARAGEELQRQKAHFDELFDLAPDALVLTDLSHPRILRINREFTRVFGYTPEEAVGKRLRHLIVPDDVPPADLTHNPDVLVGRKVEREVVRRRKDGSRFDALVTAKRIALQGDNDAMYIIYRDISDWKAAADRLRRNEAFLAEGQRISRTGSWGWELASGKVTWSEEQYRIFGFDSAEVEPSVDVLLGIVHPDDRERVRRQIMDGTRERASYAMDYRIVLPGGSVRHVRSVGRPVATGQGRVEEYIGVSMDVTERIIAEAALKLSEERYALAMEVTGDGHWDWNIVDDIYYASPIYLEMCGLPADTVITTRADWIAKFPKHPEDFPKYEEAVAAHLAGKTSTLEMEMRILVRGKPRWLHFTGQCLRDASGSPVRWAGSVTDITERKRVDEELHARQDMLDLAQKAARATAFEWWVGAPGAGANRWSSDLEVMYGLAPGTYDGTYESWKRLVLPADLSTVLDAMATAERTGDVAAEYRVVHKGGSVRWLQAKGRMFFDAHGGPARVVGFMLDVTDRRQAEDELRNMERQLRQVQRLEAMGTLAGGIAHDFNNLLGAILGYGEMALRDAPAGTRLKRDLDSIMVAGERGRALVDRVLAFSRSGVSERVPVRVQDVVGETLDLFSSGLRADVVVEARLNAGGAAIMGDATQIHQVTMNLVTNAVQAMPSGGVLRVSLDTVRLDAPRTATTGVLPPKDYVTLEVADTGSGIPPRVLERIFDPFFTTKEVGVGAGLGLSLVHGIVTGLDGVVDVSTVVDKGSVFTVYLPRAVTEIEPDGEALAERADVKPGNGERVLVVDDEESLVRLVVETLTDLLYAPVGFTSGVAALEAFTADPQRFDVVVTDESMPGMCGSDLIRRIRGIRPSIPAMVVSGYLSETIVARAREAGANEVLKKPLSTLALAWSLHRVLHQNEARDARVFS
jgi:PAS domain S-box-containing protein